MIAKSPLGEAGFVADVYDECKYNKFSIFFNDSFWFSGFPPEAPSIAGGGEGGRFNIFIIVIIAIALLIVIVILFVFIKKRRDQEEEESQKEPHQGDYWSSGPTGAQLGNSKISKPQN